MKIPRRSSALATSLALVIACAALAGCGSSTTTTSNAAATVPAGTSGATGPGGAGSGRFAALRACLAKQGITLPQRPAGTRPPGAGGGGRGFFGGGAGSGATGPRGAFGGGANSAKLQAALQKCGGGFRGAGGGFRQRLSSPTVVAALNTFVSCMRTNGINLPAPNTTGTGPVFNTQGVDTTSTAFKTAYAKCAPDLRGTFGRGATGAGGASGTGTGTA